MGNEFDAMLLEAVDEALKGIFGQTATRTIYAYMESRLSMKREEIPKRLEDFHKGLVEFLGSGAFVVEEVILKNLHWRLGVKRGKKSARSFADYVNRLRSKQANQVFRSTVSRIPSKSLWESLVSFFGFLGTHNHL